MDIAQTKAGGEIEVSQSPEPQVLVDNFLDSGISDRAPSHAAVVAALTKKQDKVSSSDEIPEGKENLYFRAERALEAVHEFVVDEIEMATMGKQPKIKDSDDIVEGSVNQYFKPERAVAAVEGVIQSSVRMGIATKQDPIKDSDEIKEGKSNLYYSDNRARAACIIQGVEYGFVGSAPSSNAVFKALSLKQDVIKSSDDISEGLKNKFFSEAAVSKMIEEALKACAEQIQAISKKCVDLQAQVDDLKPKWSDQLLGGTGTVRFCAGLSQKGARWGQMTFQAGRLAGIELPGAPTPIGPSD